jgi:TRAP-type C4-dicarboxylate transport system substrate-binding protein
VRKKTTLVLVVVGALVVLSLLLGLFGCTTQAPTTQAPTTQAPTTQAPTTQAPTTQAPTTSWEGVTWRFSTAWPPPESSVQSRVGQVWADEVTKQTSGKIQFEFFYGGSLGMGPQQHDLISQRVVDVIVTYPWYTQTLFPLQNFEYVFPFYTADFWTVYQTRRDLMNEFPIFYEEVEKINAKLVWQVPTTVFTIETRQPINNLWDFTGKKIGVIGSWFGKILEAAGASPVLTPGYERYVMLQNGVLDGTLDPSSFTHGYKSWEVARNVLENPISTNPFLALWINMDSWNELPPDIQAIVERVNIEVAERVTKELASQWDVEVFAIWRESGINFTKLSDEEMARWYNNCPDIPAEWAANMEELGYPGFEIANRFQDIAEQYGFNWVKRWAVQ